MWSAWTCVSSTRGGESSVLGGDLELVGLSGRIDHDGRVRPFGADDVAETALRSALNLPNDEVVAGCLDRDDLVEFAPLLHAASDDREIVVAVVVEVERERRRRQPLPADSDHRLAVDQCVHLVQLVLAQALVRVVRNVLRVAYVPGLEAVFRTHIDERELFVGVDPVRELFRSDVLDHRISPVSCGVLRVRRST